MRAGRGPGAPSLMVEQRDSRDRHEGITRAWKAFAWSRR